MSEPNRADRGVLKRGLLIAAAAFAFCFALVPLYRIACEHVLGIQLERAPTDAATAAATKVDTSRWVTVQFVTSVNSHLPWDFDAEQASVKVHPGEMAEAWFDANNTSARDIVGNAVPSVAPHQASLYFKKTECFCFTEQVLKAGESRRMPVRFFVDPQLPGNIETLTLSYTFYQNDVATQRLAEAAAAAKPAS
jgi:cytochrome c oxidase assembly protein subunit 11